MTRFLYRMRRDKHEVCGFFKKIVAAAFGGGIRRDTGRCFFNYWDFFLRRVLAWW
jgi:hypothetical protein